MGPATKKGIEHIYIVKETPASLSHIIDALNALPNLLGIYKLSTLVTSSFGHLSPTSPSQNFLQLNS